MKAIVFREGIFSVIDGIPVPQPGQDSALIQVISAGVCRTDLEIFKGYMGFSGIPGHEFVGRVVQASDRRWIGHRVVGEINTGCGVCEFCRLDLARHCPDRSVLGILNRNGCFAEYVELPESNLRIVPSGIDDDAAVLIEPLAAALEILEQYQVFPGCRIAVLGDGPVGILCAAVLTLSGNSVRLVGHHPSKLQKACLIAPGLKTEHSRKHPDRCTPEYDLVVEATGCPDAFQEAVERVRPRGTIIVKSTYAGTPQVDLSRIVVQEITVIGSRCGRFDPAIQCMASGQLALRHLITRRVHLNDIHSIRDLTGGPDHLKTIIEIGECHAS